MRRRPTFAYECFADHDIFWFLREHCQLRTLNKLHSGSQGEVVNDVLVRGRAETGMVDEDLGRSHHGLRDKMVVISNSHFLALRRQQDRHLIIVKPELEECFLRSMRRVNLEPSVPNDADKMRTFLNLPDHKMHQAFREDLVRLHEESRRVRAETFVTELEEIMRRLA